MTPGTRPYPQRSWTEPTGEACKRVYYFKTSEALKGSTPEFLFHPSWKKRGPHQFCVCSSCPSWCSQALSGFTAARVNHDCTVSREGPAGLPAVL